MIYYRAAQLTDRGPNTDLSSVKTGTQAPELVAVSTVTGCKKADAPFTKLC